MKGKRGLVKKPPQTRRRYMRAIITVGWALQSKRSHPPMFRSPLVAFPFVSVCVCHDTTQTHLSELLALLGWESRSGEAHIAEHTHTSTSYGPGRASFKKTIFTQRRKRI